MLRNAAKYNVKPDIVSLELQQLGLPKRMWHVLVRMCHCSFFSIGFEWTFQAEILFALIRVILFCQFFFSFVRLSHL
jgi:hypothetical protein